MQEYIKIGVSTMQEMQQWQRQVAKKMYPGVYLSERYTYRLILTTWAKFQQIPQPAGTCLEGQIFSDITKHVTQEPILCLLCTMFYI